MVFCYKQHLYKECKDLYVNSVFTLITIPICLPLWNCSSSLILLWNVIVFPALPQSVQNKIPLMESLIITIQPRRQATRKSTSQKVASNTIWKINIFQQTNMFVLLRIYQSSDSLCLVLQASERAGARQEGLESTGLRKKHYFISIIWTKIRNAAWAIISGVGVQHW